MSAAPAVDPWIPGTAGLSLTQIKAMLLARWMVVLGVAAAVLLLAVLYSVTATRMYSATATLLIDYQANDPIRSERFSPMLEGGYFNTQARLLESTRVMIDALKRVGLMDNAQARAEFQEAGGGRGSFESWLAEQMADAVSVSADPEDRVVEVTVESDDPVLAADLANAIVDAYLYSAVELAREPASGQASRFEERLGATRAAVQQAQDELTEYQQAEAIVDIGERVSTEQEKLSQLTREATEAQSQRQEAEARVALIERMRNSGQPVENFAERLGNPLVLTLRDRLSELRAEQAEQSRVLGHNHPRYRQMTAEINTVAAQLDAEISDSLEALRGEARLARQRESSLNYRLRQQRQHVLDLERKRDRQAVLKRDLAAAESRFLAASDRLDRVELSAGQTAPGASVVARATVPVHPDSPNAKLNVVMGAVLGGVLGCVLALVLELLFRRVRSRGDLERELGMPVLAEIR